LIKVRSWENDADNYKNEEILVQDEERAKAIVKFCWLFKSKSRGTGGIGNIYDSGRPGEIEAAQEVLKEFLESHPNFFDEVPEKEEYLLDWIHEFAYDLGLAGGDYFTRVCEDVNIIYFPEEVYCEDLTKEWNE